MLRSKYTKPGLLKVDILVSCCDGTIILKKNGEVLVFGGNDHGQLGLGHNIDQNKPVLLMKDELIKKICCGERHSMILTKDAQLLVTGSNIQGQLGLTEVQYQNIFVLLLKDEQIHTIC